MAGRPKNTVNMFKTNSNRVFSEGMKSKGILDDFAIRKNIYTNSGTIQKVPVNDKDIANKAYVDSVAGGGGDGLWEVDGTETQLITPDAIDMQSEDINNINILVFDKITDPTFIEGQLWYSNDTSSLSFHDGESDVTLQIGQELWIPVRNNSGTDIPDFTPVYQTGAVGHRATIALGKADTETTSKLIGITTHSIENNSNGFITVEGSINNIDTDGSSQGETWNNGDTLYLSHTTAGAITNIRPTGEDDFVIELGKVLDANNNGSFLTKGLQTTNILDEDTMTTNSSTQAPSQQSTKAYVDTSVTGLATETYVDNSVAAVVDSAPETLDTLNELADALGDDPNFATTVATSIGTNTTAIALNTTHRSSDGKDHSDVVTNNAKISFDSTSSTKLGTIEESAEVNNISDINATDLTDGGDTTLHDHDGISENTSARHTQGTDTTLGSGAIAEDHGTAATDQIVNICYGTSETAPTASTTTEGALYITYTA